MMGSGDMTIRLIKADSLVALESVQSVAAIQQQFLETYTALLIYLYLFPIQ